MWIETIKQYYARSKWKFNRCGLKQAVRINSHIVPLLGFTPAYCLLYTINAYV
jgi:hypothetical protein